MTITTPSGLQVTTAQQLLVPAVMQQPLLRALQNLNYLHRFHQPPVASVAWTGTAADATAAEYVIPVMPSADGLLYTFRHRYVCSAASQSVQFDVEETSSYTGGSTTWNSIASDTDTSNGTGGEVTEHTQTGTIAATTEALKVTIGAPASGTRTDHHFLAYPSPAAWTVGIKSSGGIPFDDGMLAHADDGAVHTELLNRLKTSAAAILTDRKQNCLSFAQEESNYRHVWDAKAAAKFYPLPPGRVWIPHQAPTAQLDLRVIASVDGGSNTDLIRIRQTGGVPSALQTTLDADGTVVSGTLDVKLQGQGLMTWADLELAVKRVASQETRFLAAMAYYTPGT